MYGMQGKFTAHPGKRDDFIQILLRAADRVGQLPTCHLYTVSEDLADENGIIIVEIWDDKPAHNASLQDPNVRALIGEAMPLMAGAPSSIEFNVVGGHGLPTNEG